MPVWVIDVCIFSVLFNSSFGAGIGISAFLNLTSNSMLMKTESLVRGAPEVSGAIVKRQQKKKADPDEGDDDESADRARRKKKAKMEDAPATPADSAKDTSEKFEYILRKGIEDAQRQHPGKVIVVLIDGGGPHTCEPFVSLRPSKLTSAEIEDHLRGAGLWPKGGEKVMEAKRIYTNSAIPRTQWTNAELIALELGAVAIYIPLNHPHLNVIEQVWRGVKQNYRMYCFPKNLKNMIACAQGALTGRELVEDVFSEEALQRQRGVCSIDAMQRRKQRTALIARHLAANPNADPLAENKLRGKNFKPSPEINVSQVPNFGSLTSPDGLLHVQLYAHHLNQARLKQYRKGEVSALALPLFVVARADFCSTLIWRSCLLLISRRCGRTTMIETACMSFCGRKWQSFGRKPEREEARVRSELLRKQTQRWIRKNG